MVQRCGVQHGARCNLPRGAQSGTCRVVGARGQRTRCTGEGFVHAKRGRCVVIKPCVVSLRARRALAYTCACFLPRRHNGCWFESPQAAEMTALARYEPYVVDVVRRFGNDSRVVWLEISNEPRAPNADFVFALRDAGYRWASELNPSAPIISC